MLILLCQINAQARHTRRETGIQCHGWQAQTHPRPLDSCGAFLPRTPMGEMPTRSWRIGPAIHAGMTTLENMNHII
ncbi:MAG: hypothetical protein ACXWTL_10100 [Methylobacter sp.]